ncbi:MAG: phosphate/phosphite/phosphonate ABC transporter, periplasmic binding protein [uncultured archaeon A07HR67]|nr:MAG: phosphate/phosphite/phosphonate ABC transporter, periplasmic binding protein [uncultured archaeon A07HR67]
MVEDTDGRVGPSSRRRFILTGGALGLAGLAGCASGGSGSSGDGNNEASTESSGDGGGSSSEGDPMLTDASEFDPANPGWEDHNFLSSALVDEGYQRGSTTDLENMRSREVEEVPHGDPVQETPSDENELLDPDTLVFTESPSEDVQGRFEEDFQAVFDRIEEETGKPVEFSKVDSYAASVEAMRSERAHIANFSTGTTAFAVNLGGAVPFGVGLTPEEEFGYRLFATTRADADDIQSVEDFARDDVTVGHSEPASNSGHQAPSALFDQYFDVTAEEDYTVNFSGGHGNTTRGIAAGDYDAGPICSTCFVDTVEAQSDLSYDDFKVVWASAPFPSGPVAYRYNLKPEIQEGIERAYLESDFSGTDYEERTGYNKFVPIDYRTVWKDIMIIQRYNDVEYSQSALGS